MGFFFSSFFFFFNLKGSQFLLFKPFQQPGRLPSHCGLDGHSLCPQKTVGRSLAQTCEGGELGLGGQQLEGRIPPTLRRHLPCQLLPTTSSWVWQMGQGLEQRDGQAQLTASSAGHKAGFSVANVNLVSRQPRGVWLLQLRKMRLRESHSQHGDCILPLPSLGPLSRG